MKTDRVGKVATAAFLAVACVFAAMVLARCVSVAWGSDEMGRQELADKLLELQPALTESAALAYSGVFARAGEESDVSPLLLGVITMRESSFFPAIVECERLGSVGQERGAMQIWPGGRAQSFAPRGCYTRMCEAECNIRTGAAYLDACRSWCPGSTWRMVAAYGRCWRNSRGECRCPTEEEARQDRATRRAKRLWDEVGGGEW